MPRFTLGARVRYDPAGSTGVVGTIIEVLERHPQNPDVDRYRVELTGGEVKTLSDLELAPAGTGPVLPEE